MKGAIPLLFALLCACGSPDSVELGEAGSPRVIVDADPFCITILSVDGNEVLKTLTTSEGAYGPPGATEDRYDMSKGHPIPGWDSYAAKEGPWQHTSSAELDEESDTVVKAVFTEPNATVTIELQNDRVKVTQTVEIDAPKRNVKSGLGFVLPEEEHFFGLGERYASVDHRGLSIYTWAEEAGIGQGEGVPRGDGNPYPNGVSMTYYPVPFFLSSAGYGLLIDTTYRSEVHLGSEKSDAWRLAVSTTTFGLTIYVQDDPTKTLDAFTADTGRPFLPADWVFGPRRRMSAYTRVGGELEYQLLRTAGVPMTAMDDAVHVLPNRSDLGRETELTERNALMHAHGYKVMAYNNPYVSQTIDEAKADYEYGAEHGYFAVGPDRKPGLTVLISGKLQSLASVDFTNPDAVAWYKSLLQITIDLGYDGWMHDFGEYIERDWHFHDGSWGDEMHNLYPVLSAKAAFEHWMEKRPDDFLIFIRAGYTGSQAFTPAVWGGDPEATFDDTQGIPASLRGGLNLALSGVPFWGSDVNGFKCMTDDPRDKEVFLRWAQLGAVSPIMQDQNACTSVTFSGGRKEKWTLWSDAETTQVYGEMTRLHTRLLPYFLILAREAHATGMPLMRHPFLFDPKNPSAWAIEDAFFLGPALYAWPVVKRGARQKEGYLPVGTYVDLDDYQVYQGGTRVTIPAPLQKLPLLLVAGHLLPMLDPTIQTLAPATEPNIITQETVRDRLDVIVALAPSGNATLTLVDGTRLTAERTSDAQNPMGLTETATISLPGCSRCFHREQVGDVERVRVNSDEAASSELRFSDLVLKKEGGPSRRIRWDVLRLNP